jgi:gas vesicle protein
MANRIYIQVDINSANAEQTMKAVNQQIADTGPTAEKSSQQATNAIRSISTTIDQASTATDKLAIGLAGMGVARVAKEFFGMGDELNRLQLSMAAITGDIEIFSRLQAIARQTGAPLKDLAEAATTLANAGVPVGELAAKMQILTDASARTSKGFQSIVPAAQAVAQLLTRETVNIRSLTAFKEFGVQPLNLLKDLAHQTRQSIQEDMKLVNPQAFLDQMFQQMRQRTEGFAGSLAQILPGSQFGILKNQINELALALETALAPALIEVAKQLGDVIKVAAAVTGELGKLPTWVKELAVALGLLAIAAKAVSAAFALWNWLPAIGGMVGRLLPVFATFTEVLEGPASITTLMGEASIGATGLTAAFAGMLPVLLAIAAPLAAIGIAVGLYRQFHIDEDEERQVQKAIKDRGELAQKSQDLENQLRAAGQLPKDYSRTIGGQPVGADQPQPAFHKMFLEDAQANYNRLLEIQKAANEKAKGLYDENEKERKKAEEYAANLLDDSYKRLLRTGEESIAALTYAYDEHFRKVVISAKATHDVLLALENDTATEVQKRLETVKKAREKADLENAALTRRISTGQMAAIPDDTHAAQQQLAQRDYLDRQQEYLDQAADQKRIDDEYTQRQIEGVGKVLALEEQRAGTAADRLQAEQRAQAAIDGLRKASAEQHETIDKQAELRIQLARVEANKKANEAIYLQEKETRDAATALQIQQINATRDLQVAAAGEIQAHTLEQQLAGIKVVEEANLAALDRTRQAQANNAEDARKQFELALTADNTLTADQVTARMAEFDRKAHEALLSQQADYDRESQLIRIESWKQGNEAIIAQQRTVFESLQSTIGEFFDALTEKSKSVWSAIGDVIKKTLLNAIKAVVTSQLAAMLTGMLGYGQVSFAQGPLGTRTPVFGGAGSPLGVALPLVNAVSSGVNFGGAGGGQGSANRSVDQVIADARGGGIGGADLPEGLGSPIVTPPFVQSSAPLFQQFPQIFGLPNVARPAAQSSYGRSLQQLKDSFDIGKPITVDNGTGLQTVPWSSASTGQQLGAILKSPGFASLEFGLGATTAISGFQRGTPGGLAQGVAGSTLAGVGAATLFPALGLTSLGGGLLGAGIGVMTAGLIHGGYSGLAMSVGGGALTGAIAGTAIFPGLGTLAGAAIGAAVGAVAGLIRLAFPGKAKEIQDAIRRTYGINITDQKILQQLVDLTNQKYGGNVQVAVYSQEVQELVRSYAMATGQSQGGLPRPMYSATFAESQAGGLQLQPVYSGGQLVQNPYTGVTTTQMQNSLNYNPAFFMQLNPQQAASLFQGQVVQVLGSNPGAVSGANSTALRAGQSRAATTGAMLEPATVLR